MELLHIKYIRLSDSDDSPVVKSANVSRKTISLIKKIPWIKIKTIEKCNKSVKQDYLLK